jgi:hypothetical protein
MKSRDAKPVGARQKSSLPHKCGVPLPGRNAAFMRQNRALEEICHAPETCSIKHLAFFHWPGITTRPKSTHSVLPWHALHCELSAASGQVLVCARYQTPRSAGLGLPPRAFEPL